MRDCCCFNFTFEEQQLEFFLFEEQTLDFGVGMCYAVISGDRYTGEYEVTPKTIAQYLATQDKTMSKDVTVYEIPYAETTNEYGTTVTIAS